MRQQVRVRNTSDGDGRPAGGFATGTGIDITWQDGPLGSGADRKAPNGAFVEDVLAVCRARLAFYQQSEFRCEANESAMHHIDIALDELDARTLERQRRGVEGTHEL